MTRCKLKILGLSEVRWKNSGDITTSDNHYMIYSGNSTTHINGVGIVITTKIKKSLMEWNPVSDRLITARFRAKNRNITIIQCYAPTEVADDSEKDYFYNQLQSTIASAHKRDIKLIMGDFNGKIGNNNNNLDEIMGRHGLGKACNNNGERLIDLCIANQLFIGSTRFPHKDIHKYIWQAPDRVTRNQIDHVLIDKKHLKSLLDVRTMRSADMYSDHKLVVNKGERRNFCETVTAKVNNISPTISAKEKWELVQKAYVESANEVIGTKNSTREMWITNETWELIEQRRTLNQHLNQVRSDLTLARYNNIEKQIKKMARRDRRKFEENIITDAEVAAEQKDVRKTYQYNCDIDYTTSSRISTKSPSVAEIRLAIKKLKNNKAAGSDGIAPELFKTDPSFAAETLAPIITEVWDTGNIPAKWKQGMIIIIPKKGDLRELEQAAEFNSPLYLTFVDFERAFDTVTWPAIWKTLEKFGIPAQITRLIKEYWYWKPVMEKCNQETTSGIQWLLTRRLDDLDYADDIVLLSHTHKDAQGRISALQRYAAEVGLKINTNKTKIMRIGTNISTPISIEGRTIEEVNDFVYLGCVIAKDGGTNIDVSKRINKARQAFFRFNKIWRSSKMYNIHKLRLFNACIKSVLLYGCETWKNTDGLINKLQVFVNKCLRRILRLFWPNSPTNEEVYCASPTNDIVRAKSAAAHSSSLGIVKGLRGATFDFAINSETVTDSMSEITLRYTTAAYATDDASAKP
ncbi:PREDICTED: uncharacterized protein LOC108782558 [Cyphomyrmex costatus]|uniref:uncharacterized protein LOC108782558 n=1 Tax=Cyphomyrmex costatus TaxID=456900 RepID=UPI0008523065|nr:PREDICTED: uncharacterized protein LOC108782558 [Cyphomyrmex costatus]